MNSHPHSSITLLKRVECGLVPLVRTVLLICLFGSTTQAQQQGGWSTTGSLSSARVFGHTATLLTDGRVLVVGGSDVLNPCCSARGSAELYDPATEQWSITGNLLKARIGHTATRLANGKILVTGGASGANLNNAEISAETYDPASGAWSPTGTLIMPRAWHRATLLDDGRVLITGGTSHGGSFGSLDTAELYDPATGVWSPAGTMNSPRDFHTATLLWNGKVLVVGGLSDIDNHNHTSAALRSAELYDPTTGGWAGTGDLITAHVIHTATLLSNGKVLVTGGGRDDYPWDHCNGVDKVEVYDPATGQWSATGSLATPRALHTTTLLPNGSVLVTGGFDDCKDVSSAEVYDPDTENWSITGSLSATREGHAATLLANGQVLVTGGYVAGGRHNSTELYNAGFEGPLLILNSTAYCIGDPWNLSVIRSPSVASVHLIGASNGSIWEIARWGTTDQDRSYSASGTIAEGTEGTHTLRVEINGIRSNPVTFAVSTCQP